MVSLAENILIKVTIFKIYSLASMGLSTFAIALVSSLAGDDFCCLGFDEAT